MKIGIDAFGLDHGKSGLGSYLKSFVNNLPDDSALEFELFGDEVDRYTYKVSRDIPFSGISIKDSVSSQRLWHLFSAGRFAKKSGYDAVLYTAAARMIPSRFSVPGIAVVNDIVGSRFRKEDFLAQRQIRRGLSRADCIIVPSMFVKKNLERSGVRCRRVEIVHNGIDHSLFFPVKQLGIEGEIADIKPFAIQKPYIIYASRMQSPEKKHVELIEAFSLFKERTKLPHRLVIAGSDGPYSRNVHEAAFASSAASDIFITGYFPHESFPDLYRNSEACIFPSVNEGVGLPVLEAMATGIPVACAKAGALPEIAGSNALFFDSGSTDEFATCIEQIVSDSSLRKKLSEGGLAWSRRFSWEKCAQETISIIRSIVR